MLIVDRKPQFGHWTGEITNADLRSYRRGDWSDALLPLREKRWQYVGLYSDDFIIGLAVVHAGYLGNIFAYVYDRKTQFLWEMERNAPLANGIRFARGFEESVICYRAEKERLRFDNNLILGKRGIDVRLKNDGMILDIRAEIVDRILEHPPLQVLLGTPDGDCSFTHKTAGLEVEGTVRLGNKHWDLKKCNTLAAIDKTVGYHARKTEWNWASLAGISNGKVLGLILTNPTPEQNVFWVDKELHRVGPVTFQYTDEYSPWSIKTTESDLANIELEFTPRHCRRQHINFGVLESRFIQPCGEFSGWFETTEGQRIEVNNIPGVVEEHFARW